MTDVRMVAWKDRYRRYIHTGSGTLVVEPGETAIVIIGRDFDAKVLAALGVSQSDEPTEDK